MANITIKLDPDLYAKLNRAAGQMRLPVEQFAAECIAQSLEVALRHRVVLQRVEDIDTSIVQLAEFLAETRAAITEITIVREKSDQAKSVDFSSNAKQSTPQ